MNHWIRPSCGSRIGASHLRRGAPCQDASGFAGVRDAAGTPVQVLVVSDGHGGSRYVRSDVGARLACEVAMGELQQALAMARVDDPAALEDWRRWLAEELPARIVAAWLQEVERHWRADPVGDGSGFSPVVYGATLGVLLLTPSWWAHTGLGDWDLVRIEAAGGEVLLSEEPEGEAAGEATFSLCLPRAERHFASRTALLPLTADTAPFALLLCSDGLRKSCGSDADFLTLCRYLAGLAPAADPADSAELAEALDHISRQGSGDDISVALARWAAADQAEAWPGPGRNRPARLVQPMSGMASGLPVSAVAAGGLEAEASGTRLAPEAMSGQRVAPPHPGSAPGETPPIASRRAQPASAGAQPVLGRRLRRSHRRRGYPWWVVALVLLGLGGAALVIAAVLGRGPLAGRREPASLALTPGQRSDLRRQVALLCDAAAPPGGGQEPGAAALERTTAAGRRADAAGSGIPAARQGPAALAGSSAAGGAPSPPGLQPGASTTGRPPGGPVARGSDAVVAGSSLSPGSGMVQGTAVLPAPPTAAPIAPASGAFSSGMTGVSRSPDPQRLQRLQRIAATLAARASIFQRLERGEPAPVTTALRQSQADPLTALIAYSATDPTLRPAPSPPKRMRWWSTLGRRAAGLLPFAPRPGGSASEPVSPLEALGACPELTQALRSAWQRRDARGAVQGPAASAAAAVRLQAGGDGRAPSGVSGPAGAPRPAAMRLPASPNPGASSR